MQVSKKITGLVILFALMAVTVVKASISHSVSVKSKDTGEYPRVVLEMGISGQYDSYYAKDFKIIENGKRNIGPIIFLNPSVLVP